MQLNRGRRNEVITMQKKLRWVCRQHPIKPGLNTIRMSRQAYAGCLVNLKRTQMYLATFEPVGARKVTRNFHLVKRGVEFEADKLVHIGSCWNKKEKCMYFMAEEL